MNTFALWQDMAKRGWFQNGVADANLAPQAQDLFTSGGAGFYTGLIGDAYDWKDLGKAMNPSDLGAYLGPQIEQDFPLQGVGPGELSASLNSATGTAFTVAKSTKSSGRGRGLHQVPDVAGAGDHGDRRRKLPGGQAIRLLEPRLAGPRPDRSDGERVEGRLLVVRGDRSSD